MKKKEKISLKIDIKPQNKTAMALSNFSGGVHEKTNKAKRKAEKMKLRKEILNSFLNFLKY